MPVLTAKGAATRQRIVEGAAAEIRENGVAATTLDDVRSRTGTSKGQLFHYFPGGKEELLLAVARHEAGRVLSDQQPHLSALTSWEAWLRWRDAVVDRYRGQGQHCPLNVLVSQLGRGTPGAQAVLGELMRQWQGEITVGIRHMQDAGEVRAELDAGRAAAALLAGIQGGVVMMLSSGRLTHLEAALDVGIEHLRGAGSTAVPGQNVRMDDAARAYIDAIEPAHRPLFDRLHQLVVEEFPDADVVLSHAMPTFSVGDQRLHVGVWKHGVSLYGWDGARDGGIVARRPELSSGRGTLRLRPRDAEQISDDELRALVRGALTPRQRGRRVSGRPRPGRAPR
ncbi:MAG: hypothetical protein QOG20_1618 [Pseudonocardiales bacterium]|nr:hypothetical protein [Pseudonocardiales bacterium]